MESEKIEWTTERKPREKQDRLELERCPAGASPVYLCLSDTYVSNRLHYWQGRSYPHLLENCPACEAGNTPRDKHYVVAHDLKRHKTVIVELTDAAADEFDEYLRLYQTCRGAAFRLVRKSGKINGRISCEMRPSNEPDNALPRPPDLKASLVRMWGSAEDRYARPPSEPRKTEPPNRDLAAKNNGHRNRFTTEGSPQTPVYETTEEQRQMLARNREKIAEKLLPPKEAK